MKTSCYIDNINYLSIGMVPLSFQGSFKGYAHTSVFCYLLNMVDKVGISELQNKHLN